LNPEFDWINMIASHLPVLMLLALIG